MRLHTSLAYEQVEAALRRAKDKKRVAPGVQFADTNPPGSASLRNIRVVPSFSHPSAYEVQLGTEGDNTAYVTWHEWGWFMAEVFAADPDAMFGSGYDGVDSFNEKTDYQFELEGESNG